MKGALLAFCGNGRGAGKDTAANYVEEWCEAHNFSVQRLAFAQPGKRLVAEILGWESDVGPSAVDMVDDFKLRGNIHIESGANWGSHMSGRQFIINVLDGVRHVLGINTWTDAVLPTTWTGTQSDVTVIADLRFPHEARRVLSLQGRIVEIHRDEAEGGPAEGELTAYTFDRIDNNASFEHLRTSVFALMDDFTKIQV